MDSGRYSRYPNSGQKMSNSKTCNLKNFTQETRDALGKQNENVNKSLERISEDADRLKSENKKYIKNELKMRKELKKDYKGLTKVHNLMKKDRTCYYRDYKAKTIRISVYSYINENQNFTTLVTKEALGILNARHASLDYFLKE